MKILNYIKTEFPKISNRNFKKHLTKEWIDDNFMFYVNPEKCESLIDFCDKMHANYLGKYFSGIWPAKHSYPESGKFLINFIKSTKNDNVIDIGCGDNYYKDKVPNLIGLDPYHDAADIKKSLEEYKPKIYFDHVIALGSLNFGSHPKDTKHIETMFKKMVDMTFKGGYLHFRFNPGLDHKPIKKDKFSFMYIDWYPWTREWIYELLQKYNLKLIRFALEYNHQNDERFFIIVQKV